MAGGVWKWASALLWAQTQTNQIPHGVRSYKIDGLRMKSRSNVDGLCVTAPLIWKVQLNTAAVKSKPAQKLDRRDF